MSNSSLQHCLSFLFSCLFFLHYRSFCCSSPRRLHAGRPSGSRSIMGAGLQQRRQCPKSLHDQVELVGLCLLLLLLHTMSPCHRPSLHNSPPEAHLKSKTCARLPRHPLSLLIFYWAALIMIAMC